MLNEKKVKIFNDTMDMIKNSLDDNLKKTKQENFKELRKDVLTKTDTEMIKNPEVKEIITEQLEDIDRGIGIPFNSEIVDSEYKRQAEMDEETREREAELNLDQQQRWGEEPEIDEDGLDKDDYEYYGAKLAEFEWKLE